MKNEIIAQIKSNKDTLSASFEIANNLDHACSSLLADLKKQVKELGEELNLKTSFYMDLNKKFSGINFYKEEWETAKISFQFQNYDQNLVYGISRKEECKELNNPLNIGVYDNLMSLGGKTTTWWPFCKDVDPMYSNWDNYNQKPWLAIIDGSMKEYIKQRVEEVVQLLNGHKL